MKKVILLLSVISVLASSCVSKKQFTELQNQNSKNLEELAIAKKQLADTSSELDKEQNKIVSL